MKLLIVTQKVNKDDPVLGFFHAWLICFAGKVEELIVVCLEEGVHDLPSNVKVYSLGKEHGFSKIRILYNFFTIIRKKPYDKVLVHMNPIYIVVAGWIWRWFLKKDVFLWYTHKSVDWKLRIAEKFTLKIFTASKESFRLRSTKVVVTGHGIDTDVYVPDYSQKRGTFEILSVGRISETKDLKVVLDALCILKDRKIDVQLTIVGGPITKADRVYEKHLHNTVSEKGLSGMVNFVGPITPLQSIAYFQRADIFVHTSNTGSLDKVVLESMACGTPVVSSNDAVVPIVIPLNAHFAFISGDVQDLAEKLIYFSKMKDDIHYLQEQVRGEVVQHHSLDSLIERLVAEVS